MKKASTSFPRSLSRETGGQVRSDFLRHRSRIPFLACLSDREARALDAEVVERRFSKGEIILLEEDTCNYLYIVYSGRVKAVRTSADGSEHILAIHRK
ncbi:MAG: Crp/Fnr family transcriptional regulator, partial [Acidobacteriota bacterium]